MLHQRCLFRRKKIYIIICMVCSIITVVLCTKPSSSEITIACVGDICLGRFVEETLLAQYGTYTNAMISLQPVFNHADIVVGNLECALTTSTNTCATDKGRWWHIKAHPNAVRALSSAGIDIVSIANNHVGDWGKEGFIETMKTLDEAGIQYFGGGQTITAAQQPLIVRTNGICIAFIGACEIAPREFEATMTTPGTLWLTTNTMLSAIHAAKMRHADFIIVFPHWGTEYISQPPERIIQFGHMIIDAGADIVMGAHPHTLQGCEWYNDGLICYSMGNFVFDMHDRNLRETAVFTLTLLKKGNSKNSTLQLTPCIIDRSTCTVAPAVGDDAAIIKKHIPIIE